MTVDAVKHVRESFQSDSLYMVIYDDSGYSFSNASSFVIWNDDRELVICVRTNNDHYSNIQAPFSILAVPYEKINSIVSKCS